MCRCGDVATRHGRDPDRDKEQPRKEREGLAQHQPAHHGCSQGAGAIRRPSHAPASEAAPRKIQPQLGILTMATTSSTAQNSEGNQAAGGHHVPEPKLEKTIDLSDLGPVTSAVKKMTFSPDGRFLAIVDNPTHMKTDIVVWDMLLDRKQSHIHCPFDYGDLRDHDLLWSRDGKVISFGAKRQWDPMTGEDLPDNPAIGRAARLNKDGSKMLTIVGPIGQPSTIHVYDTSTWALQKIYVDGFAVETAAWTAEDKILVGVHVSRETLGKEIDGRTISQMKDIAVRLLHPTGKESTKAVWFPAKPTNDPKSPFTYAFPVGSGLLTNFVTNQIFLDAGKIIDGVTLKIDTYHAEDESNIAPGAFGMGFSPDGLLLYLKGASFRYGGHAPIKNSVVDRATGKLLSQFRGAMDHQGSLAVSPNGKHLALGDIHSVLIFRLQ